MQTVGYMDGYVDVKVEAAGRARRPLTVIGTATASARHLRARPEHAARQSDRGVAGPGDRQHGAARRDDAVHLPAGVYLGYAICAVPGAAKRNRVARRRPIRGHSPHRSLGSRRPRPRCSSSRSSGRTSCSTTARAAAVAESGADPAQRQDAAGAGDRPAVGVHLPLPDLRRRGDGRALPAGDQEVAFHVTSLDAIHSFWVVELGVKADANPGVDNIAYVKPKGSAASRSAAPSSAASGTAYMFNNGRVVRPPSSGPGPRSSRGSTPRSSPSWTSPSRRAARRTRRRTSPRPRGEPDDRRRRRPAPRAGGAS